MMLSALEAPIHAGYSHAHAARMSSNLTASAIFKALIYQGFFIFWHRLTVAGRL